MIFIMDRKITFLLICYVGMTDSQMLIVDETLFDQVMHGNTQKFFTIHNLVVDAKYEVRISYPAVVPTDFMLTVKPVTKSHSSRTILNVEQLQWKAEFKSYQIKVVAHRTGLPLNVERLNDPVPFNIVVNRLYLGCSLATWKIICICLLVNIIVLMISVPRLLNMLDRMVGLEKTE